MFSSAMEAMDFQINTKLGTALDALWQEVIDYRDIQLKDLQPKDRREKLHEYFGKNIVKKYFDVVWKYAGLWVDEMEFKRDFQSSFATCIFVGDWGADQIQYVMSAGLDKIDPRTSIKTAEEMLKIVKAFDPKTGGIKTNMRNEIKKMVHCVMFFDFAEAFCIKDYFPEGTPVESLTAREITAIMLHEIGHTLSLLEYAADTYAHLAKFESLTDGFRKYAPASEQVKFIEMVADEAKKDGIKDADKLKEVAAKMKDEVGKLDGVSKDVINTYIEPLFGMAKEVSKGMWYSVKNFFANPFYNKYMSDAQYTKYSDVLTSERDMTWAERAADAYAIRHGYGKDLVTGFDKSNKAYKFFGYTKEAVMAMIKAGRFETQLSLMDKLRINAMIPSIARSRLHGLYPSGADRYREIMKVSIQGLKANNANPEFVRRYIEDIEQMIKSIENYDETRGYMAKQEVRYKLMLKYLSVTSWIDIIVHGRVVPEIEQLIGQLDRLSNNLLSFYGEKFNQLARR